MKDQAKRAKSSNKAPATNSSFAERAKGSTEAFVSAEKWLEHLEEEIEPTCQATEKEELNLVLKNSPEDFETLEVLKRVRAAVKASDDVALPESGHYYDELHSKIMNALETDIAMNGEPERAAPKSRIPFFFSLQFASRKAPAFVGALGMTMMIAVLTFVGVRQRSTPIAAYVAAEAQHEAQIEENFERKIAMVDPQSGASFARDMGSFESEEDFLTETAASRLKQISAKQADAIIRSLKR
jgi:hypothetical protein